jgi:carboxyl-terminal processing protease
MKTYRYKSLIALITISAVIFGCIKKTEGLKQSDINPIISIFLSRHVKNHTFNDELSERTLINLVEYLDPGKYYFYKSDIDELNKDKNLIDNYVEEGKFDFLVKIQEIYKKRVEEGMTILNELIKLDYDFNKDESIIIESEKTPYAQNKDEMRERWRKSIKLQLLNQYSVAKNMDKAKSKVTKRYDLLKKRMNEVDQIKLREIFLNSFTSSLDPHSNYLSQEEHEDFMISTNLKLEGIGVLLRSEDGYVMVESIVPGGAADKLPAELKLKPNDKIISVAQGDGEPVDVTDMALRDVVNRIRGDKGTVVKLTILREVADKNESPHRLIPITREEIKLQDRAAKSQVFPVQKDVKTKIKIGYLKLPSFYLDFDAVQANDPNAKSSSIDVITQLAKLKKEGIDGLVIDLRGNPGGALKEAVNIAGMFIDEGPVVQVLDESGSVQVMEDPSPGLHYDGPIVILINKFSASASEIFAGAIKDYSRGLILGSNPTFGKGTVQTYNVLPGKMGAMKITTAIFYQPAGSSNQGNGIDPDITIPDMSSVWDLGENKLRFPLQWEKIKSSKFTPYKKYLKPGIISNIKNNSANRIKENTKFQDLIKKIAEFKERRNKNEVSLKEEAKNEQSTKDDIEKQNKQEEVNLIDLDNDLFLQESFNITADYIKMLK